MGCKGSKDKDVADGDKYDKVSDFYDACLMGNLTQMQKKCSTAQLNQAKQSERGVIGNQVFPIHLGMQSNRKGVVKWLLEQGAEIDQQQGSERENVLHIGASMSNLMGIEEVFEFAQTAGKMDEFKAMINQPSTSDALTPIMIATVSGNKDIVELLCRNGADVDLKDELGKSALELCRFWQDAYALRTKEGFQPRRGHQYKEIEQILIQHQGGSASVKKVSSLSSSSTSASSARKKSSSSSSSSASSSSSSSSSSSDAASSTSSSSDSDSDTSSS